MSRIWVETHGADGRLLAAEAPAIPAEDRGLAYGDGLFETVRVSGGRPLFLSRHLRRLRSGLEVLGFPPGFWSDGELADRCRRLILENEVAEGVLKIVVTRGGGRRGYTPPDSPRPTLIVEAHPAQPASKPRELAACLAPWRVDPASPSVRVKNLSSLDKVLALRVARANASDEAIFQNLNGLLTEATSSNLFVVHDGKLLTPALHCGLLSGIVRGLLVENMQVAEAELPLVALTEADEVFLTNAASGVQPLVRFEDRPVGKGEPGPVTRRAREVYESLCAAEVVE